MHLGQFLSLKSLSFPKFPQKIPMDHVTPSTTGSLFPYFFLPFISDNINLINFHFTEQNYRAASALRQNILNKQYYYHHQIVSSLAHRECCSKCVSFVSLKVLKF